MLLLFCHFFLPPFVFLFIYTCRGDDTTCASAEMRDKRKKRRKGGKERETGEREAFVRLAP